MNLEKTDIWITTEKPLELSEGEPSVDFLEICIGISLNSISIGGVNEH
jgi:hypothetical protein